jgi:hypothetical protein
MVVQTLFNLNSIVTILNETQTMTKLLWNASARCYDSTAICSQRRTRHFDAQQSRSSSLRSLGRNVRLCDNPLPAFSYPEPFLRAVNGARRGALAKSKPDTIKTWYPVKHCACSTSPSTLRKQYFLRKVNFLFLIRISFQKMIKFPSNKMKFPSNE